MSSLFRAKADLDFPTAPAADDANFRLEPARELLLSVACEGIAAPLLRDLIARGQTRDALLGLPHGKRTPDDLLGEQLLVVRRGEGDQRLRVAGRKCPGADLFSNWRR